eukprot:scaffold6727_cov106-Isochrysis_galbana.AAC.2
MEQTPADARVAPSASGPTDMATETPPSPKRPRDPSSDNKVSQRATSSDPVWPERQIVIVTTGYMPTAPAKACQSLAHPTTPMVPYGSVAQTILSAYCLVAETISAGNCRQCFRAEHASKPSLAQSGSLLNPNPQHAVQARGKSHGKQRTTPVKWEMGKRQTVHRLPLLTTTTLTKCLTLTPPPPPLSQGKNKPPPRPPPIVEEAMEEGDDPNFVSDTNNLITIKQKQKGPTLREIRDTDMGAAITYLLLDLEGVGTEPDILDYDGKKGPWTIFATAECAEQFKAGQERRQYRPHFLRRDSD